AHQRNALGGGHTFPYAVGHGVPDEFVTIMAYEGNFNSSLRIPVFSNPYLWCGDYRCGVFREDANNSADAAYALNAVRFQAQNVYANHQNQMTFANALTGVADSAVKTCLQQAQQTHKYY